MQKVKVVFDIDGVIAGHGQIDKHSILYFLRKGAVLDAAGATHHIFPGIVELFKKIFQYPNVSIAFFSSGAEVRNVEIVEKLLRLCLGDQKYEEIKDSVVIRSKQDLSDNIPDDASKLNEQFKMRWGNKVKDLTKILSDDEILENVIFIDDDSSYVKYGQQSNLLHSREVESRDFENLTNEYFKQPSEEAKLFSKVNNSFYLASMLLKVIEEVNASESKSAAGVLFPLQFEAVPDELFHYKLKSSDNWSTRAIYEDGLLRLKEINPNLELCSGESYLNAIISPETEDEARLIEKAKSKEASSECLVM